jgi:hypothetical protein
LPLLAFLAVDLLLGAVRRRGGNALRA